MPTPTAARTTCNTPDLALSPAEAAALRDLRVLEALRDMRAARRAVAS